MSAHIIGERVGAILSANKEEVRLFGYGTYRGDEIPDDGVGGLGALIREVGNTNPKIVLDSGKVVWGCECWWGTERKIKESIGDRRVVMIDPDEMREADSAAPGDSR